MQICRGDHPQSITCLSLEFLPHVFPLLAVQGFVLSPWAPTPSSCVLSVPVGVMADRQSCHQRGVRAGTEQQRCRTRSLNLQLNVQGTSAGLTPLKYVESSIIPSLSKSSAGLKAVKEKFCLLGFLSVEMCVGMSVSFLLVFIRGQWSGKSVPGGEQRVNCKST